MSELLTRTFKIPSLIPGSPGCGACVDRLDQGISDLHGVESVVFDVGAGTLTVTYDSEVLSDRLLQEAAERTGVDIAGDLEHTAYRVSGLDCPDCAATVDKSVAHLDGVLFASLNFASGVLLVEWDPILDPRPAVERAIAQMGYGLEVLDQTSRQPVSPGRTVDRLEISTAVSGALIVAAWVVGLLGVAEIVTTLMHASAILIGGAIVARRAIGSLRARVLDMNVLMGVAVLGAAAIGEWTEGAMVVFLYALGMVLESRSLTRTRRSIRDLMDLAPPTARVLRDDEEVEIPAGEAVIGDVVMVRSGERVSVDGRILSGTSALDESAVTGESMPVDKGMGEDVYAGTLNTTGLLKVQVTAQAEDTTLARIVHLVEEAQARQAPSQRLVDRFTRYYTPAMIALAAGVAIVPTAALLLTGNAWDPLAAREWLYRGLVVLVVSCPCALVISTPVAIVSAITRATRSGVLVKGGVFLERAPSIKAIALDKTGTLTVGRPRVVSVESNGHVDPSRILEIAAALESGSTHPIARAVMDAASDLRDTAHLESFHDEAGRGVRGTVDGTDYRLGSADAAHETGVAYRTYGDAVDAMHTQGLTTLVLSSGTEALGVIGLADSVRPEAARAVEDLEDQGVDHVVMLTGDSEQAALAVAELAGVSEVRARLLPDDKVGFVDDLRDRHGPVAMVGDGINDAPALAAADIGIAMGAAGSDTALETADVALMRDDLSALPVFFDLGRRTRANIIQNVVFSIVVKLVVLALATVGVATLWMAVFADTGVALLVILNGLRLLRA